MTGVGAAPIELAKLHGAGNDFLVVVDPEGDRPVGPALARALCDRHTGIGADGVLRLLRPCEGGDVRMELRNADGSAAETSGNGLRCLVLAAVDAGLVGVGLVRVETVAGMRDVEVRSVDGAGADIAVDMGIVRLAAADLADVPVAGWRGRLADVGNPHLVLAAPSLADVDVARVGRQLDADAAGGLNVEVIAVPPDAGRPAGVLDLLVWERGAGVTLACGSGSCAAAAAAALWGLSGGSVLVRNPGGELRVELSGADPAAPRAVLSGPTVRVARLTVELASLPSDATAGVPA
jgi:diaminopimelate epimerase